MIGYRVQGSGYRVQGTGYGARTRRTATDHRSSIIVNVFILVPLFLFLLAPAVSYAAEYSFVEAKIVGFVKEMYDGIEDVQVRLNSMPLELKDRTRVKNITFVKVPDAGGDGICSVELSAAGGRSRTVQVSFKVIMKKRLFVLKASGKKDDVIEKTDVLVRETYVNGKGDGYPLSSEDVVGKILKKDVPANTVITTQMLQDPVIVKRGEIVNIVAENRMILVSAKGKSMDKGAVGDTVRVKNISSGKELLGRVVAHNTIAVDF